MASAESPTNSAPATQENGAKIEKLAPGAGAVPSSVTPRPRSGHSVVWRTIASGVLMVVSLTLGSGVFVSLAKLKKEPPRRSVAERSYNVQTFLVEPMALREIISGFGTARADRRVMLSAEVSGLVTEIHPDLEVGVRVNPPKAVGGGEVPSGIVPGSELLRIDPASYQKRVDSLERKIEQLGVGRDQLEIEQANDERLLKTQEANLKTAQAELASKERSRAAGAGNATLVRTAEFQVRQYEAEIVRLKNAIGLIPSRVESIDAQIAAAEADLASANLELDRTTIVAPFSGVLSRVSVEQGQLVRPGDPLAEVTDLNRIEVPIALTLSQYARIEPLLEGGGQPIARLAENEADQPRWEGRVVRVAPVANEQTRTVDVFVEVDNREQTVPLLPGTFVHVRVDGPKMANVTIVPRDIVVQGNVFVVREADRAEETSQEPSPTADTNDESAVDSDSTEVPTEEKTLYKAKQVALDVRRNIQGFAVVASGLGAGDEVVMTNLDVVHDGALITPQDRVTVADELERQRTPALRAIE